MGFADEHASLSVGAALLALRGGEGLALEIIAYLRGIELQIDAAIYQIDVGGAARQATRRSRLERLLARVRRIIRDGYADIGGVLNSTLTEISLLHAERTRDDLNSILAAAFFAGIGRRNARAVARGLHIEGGPITEWLDANRDALNRRVSNELRLAYGLGRTNVEVSERLRGPSTRRTVQATIDGTSQRTTERSGQIFKRAQDQAASLARTSAIAVANSSAAEIFATNRRAIYAYAALVTLDNRTSVICISRAGSVWSAESGEPLPGTNTAEDFPGFPPWHFHCRTIISIIPYSYNDLKGRLEGDQLRRLEALSPEAKAKLDGELPITQTGEEWLRSQPKSTQLEILGRGRYNLWISDKITTSELLDLRGRPLTVEQLRARYQ